MKIPLLFVVLTGAVILFGTGSTLAVMNSSCKTGVHAWCAPSSEFARHTQTSPG
jgi:hypothetical protein